ncbi:ribonuclease III domain-containing protein, partial [Proteus mirabilis]|uniref:ribonuclease III domain-containing protein n=1 Tax=Proteus mirabilis TaxID=584 RepID=UPI001EF92675
AMADLLLRRFPNEREGQLARRHAALVRARTLGEIAEAIALKDHRIAYRGAPKATPAILADMLEALLGAVFVDAGFETAAGVI